VKLSNKRKIAQVAAFTISNIGFYRVLKTGFACPFLHCHGCPLAAFGCPIGILQNAPTLITDGLVGILLFTIGSLGVYGMIFGRAFCGWACPFGALHDLLGYSNAKKAKTTNHWYSKYIMLFLTLVFAWFTLDTVFCKFCPSGSLFAAIPFRLLYPEAAGLGLFFYIHMITLALTIALAMLVSRFWCRYLCPLGAISGAFNRASILTIEWNEEECKNCEDCLEACEMGIAKMEDIGHSTDCTLCGRCVETCSESALRFATKSK